MTSKYNNAEFDQLLSDALGAATASDFDGWKNRFPDAIHHLNPVLTRKFQSRRQFARNMVKGVSAVACGIVGFWWMKSNTVSSSAFAEMIENINNAKSFTSKGVFHSRVTSADGKRTWIVKKYQEMAYKEPGLSRTTYFDKNGEIDLIDIIDTVKRRKLSIYPQTKIAKITFDKYDESHSIGPFDHVEHYLNKYPIEFVGQREVNNRNINVFRVCFFDKSNHRPFSCDYWFDAKSKDLVRTRTPGADVFDPENAPDRMNEPEKKWSTETMAGSEKYDIVFNPELDPSLFSLNPPKGFKVENIKPLDVTEQMFVEFLAVHARVNGKIFLPKYTGLESPAINKVYDIDEKDRSKDEQALLDLILETRLAGLYRNKGFVFILDKTVEGTFRYIGKGVPLGDADRIVCWYQLKENKQYRAIYADLTVKKVNPNDLPLPVTK